MYSHVCVVTPIVFVLNKKCQTKKHIFKIFVLISMQNYINGWVGVIFTPLETHWWFQRQLRVKITVEFQLHLMIDFCATSDL